eukprot:48642-Eustigmatos_ZCMA.PRE.2
MTPRGECDTYYRMTKTSVLWKYSDSACIRATCCIPACLTEVAVHRVLLQLNEEGLREALVEPLLPALRLPLIPEALLPRPPRIHHHPLPHFLPDIADSLAGRPLEHRGPGGSALEILLHKHVRWRGPFGALLVLAW